MMKKGKYTFSLVSLAVLALELALAGFSLYRAVLSYGNSGLETGCMGLLAFLMGIMGFRMAWMDRKLLGRQYHFPAVMMILHVFALILLASVYMLGAV
ncbi:MAG: hypothetical protein HFI38_00870 [Lachnospiraceae bacterium]|jgi:hypothetical protein|nr:hypothetical protein [Lachnospiraceae bacterium]